MGLYSLKLEKWTTMRSRPLKCTYEGIATSTKYHLYSISKQNLQRTRVLLFRVTQPGLPSWWRLVGPSLDWLRAFIKNFGWALRASGVGQGLGLLDIRLNADFLPIRGRLITLTRGPMARKKKSRAQLQVTRRVMQIRCSGLEKSLTLCGNNPVGLDQFTFSQLNETRTWAVGLGTPLLIIRAESWTRRRAPHLLSWS